MGSYSQHSKFTKEIPDVTVGYSYISVDDSKVFTLADGVDDSAAAVAIPSNATGAMILIEHTSSAPIMRYTVNGSTPSVASKRGMQAVDDGTIIYIGKTKSAQGDFGDLAAFKVICDTGKDVKLHVTYIRYAG